MDAFEKELIRESIEKWYRICFEGDVDEGPTDCPLCKVYWNKSKPPRNWNVVCFGCPISVREDTHGCTGTPYDAWMDHHQYDCRENEDVDEFTVACDECKNLAVAELKFLRTFLLEDV